MEITVGNGIHHRNICRACLSTENNLREMTETDSDYEHFINIYEACTTVNLKEIKDLALHICEKCILLVNEFNTFREMCLQSHFTIQTILTKSDKIVISDGAEIFVFSNNISDTIKVEYGNAPKKRKSTPKVTDIISDTIKVEYDSPNVSDNISDVIKVEYDGLPKKRKSKPNVSDNISDAINVEYGNPPKKRKSTPKVSTNISDTTEVESGSPSEKIKSTPKIPGRKRADDINNKCEICLENCNDRVSLQQHYETAHTTTDYCCALCREPFIRPSLITGHLRTHSKEEIRNSDRRLYKCNRCENRYKTIINLQIHVYSHLGLKPYKCEYCSKGFTKHPALMTHLSIHTGIHNFLCCECGRSFSTALHLKRHKVSHAETRPYQCEFCPSMFTVPRDLNVHMRTHTGEKPYLCSTCGKAFRRANHLNVHRRIHTGEKPYKCSHCDKCFTQSGDCKAHERIHTGYRPYICNVCNKKFNQTSALTTHMKKHAQELSECNDRDRTVAKARGRKKRSQERVEVKHEPFFD